MKRFLLPVLALLLAAGCSSVDKQAVEAGIARQLDMYTLSTLQDVYKSFYQECFGPGHTSLSEEEPYDGILYEPTGANGGYYRVNLYAVNAGILPAEVLLSAFLRSAAPVTPEGIKTWKKIWKVVGKVAGGFHLRGYEADKEALDAIVASDSPDKAVHHSDAYNNAYDPHYRIVGKDIFEAEILPILQAYRPAATP